MRQSVRFAVLLLFGMVLASCLLGQSITEFAIPTAGSNPYTITTGPDGALWFTEAQGNNIGRITTTGVITEFPIPAANAQPLGIALGPDGALWLTGYNVSAIGRITTGGVFSGAYLPAAGSTPWGIVAGPDGALWFTESAGNKIGRMTTDTTLTNEFPIPTPNCHPNGIAVGPDGALWFAEALGGKIGRITTSGAITEFPTPTPNSGPVFITKGPDGALWFTEKQANKIGRITTAGVITEFSITTPNANPYGIAAGPDSALWFTELASSGDRIERMTTSGVITNDVPLPTPTGGPFGITAGPDGNLWFVENGAGKIGRITTSGTVAFSYLPVVVSAPGVPPSFFKTSVQLNNPSGSPVSGSFLFHPQGVSGTPSDPSTPYNLGPHETRSYDDFLPSFGQSGIGTLDLNVTAGPAPVTVVRIFNDAGAAGTTGFNEEQVLPEDVLTTGQHAVLVGPIDSTKFRFNVGVRTLSSGASITVTVRDASGTVTQVVTKTYPATFFQQGSAADFLGTPLGSNSSMEISVNSGSIIVYGATADNITQDPSVSLAKKVS